MHQIFVIKDEKDASFGNPVFSRSTPDALRSLSLSMREGKSMQAQFPADYSLWRIGTWNEENGTMEVLNSMEWITSLTSLVEAQKGPQNGHVQQNA